MEISASSGEHWSGTWISTSQVDERLRGFVEAELGGGMMLLVQGRPSVPRAAVADYAWRVTADAAEERDEIARQLARALEQVDAPDRVCGVYFADQWAPGEDGHWWGDLYFAVSDVDRAEAELLRCAARDAANAFLENESSPYRLE